MNDNNPSNSIINKAMTTKYVDPAADPSNSGSNTTAGTAAGSGNSSLYGPNYGKPITVNGNDNQAGAAGVGSQITSGGSPEHQAQYDLASYFNGPRTDGESMNWAGGKLTYHAATNDPGNGYRQGYATYTDPSGQTTNFNSSNSVRDIAQGNAFIAKQWDQQYGTDFMPSLGFGTHQADSNPLLQGSTEVSPGHYSFAKGATADPGAGAPGAGGGNPGNSGDGPGATAGPGNAGGAGGASALPPVGIQGPQTWSPSAAQSMAGQLSALMDPHSALMQQASTQALQDMNSRGIINSSMAQTAGQAAAYNAAIPIAQTDANINAQAGQFNANAANQFAQQSNAQLYNLQTIGANEANQLQNMNLNQQFNLQNLGVQQGYNLQNMAITNQQQKDMANLNNQATRDLAKVNNDHQTLLQTNGQAQNLMTQYQAMVNSIMNNNQMDAASKQAAIDDYTHQLNSMLGLLGHTTGLDLGSIAVGKSSADGSTGTQTDGNGTGTGTDLGFEPWQQSNSGGGR